VDVAATTIDRVVTDSRHVCREIAGSVHPRERL